MNFAEIKQKLSTYTIGIAGCGGLGSNCAMALARVGIGSFVIADFDDIDESNLNRQYFFRNQIGINKAIALKININCVEPKCKVEAHNVIINADNVPRLFYHCDIIVEAFDKAEMKVMLIETVLNSFPEKYIISASGIAGWGDSDKIHIQNYEKLIICGDFETEVNENLPPLAPRVGIVANMQANIVLELLLGRVYY